MGTMEEWRIYYRITYYYLLEVHFSIQDICTLFALLYIYYGVERTYSRVTLYFAIIEKASLLTLILCVRSTLPSMGILDSNRNFVPLQISSLVPCTYTLRYNYTVALRIIVTLCKGEITLYNHISSSRPQCIQNAGRQNALQLSGCFGLSFEV